MSLALRGVAKAVILFAVGLSAFASSSCLIFLLVWFLLLEIQCSQMSDTLEEFNP